MLKLTLAFRREPVFAKRRQTVGDIRCGNAPWRTGWDSNPRYAFTYTRVPGVRLKPLGHLSFLGVRAWIGANRRNGAIYTDEFLSINRNLTVF